MECVATRSCAEAFNYFISGSSSRDGMVTSFKSDKHEGWNLSGFGDIKVILIDGILLECITTRLCAETFNYFIFGSSSRDGVDMRFKSDKRES